jgi:glycosyltransferase involved in cell wall biosynthesis
MAAAMQVSVIVPAYNSETLIGDTLRSIVAQPVEGVEVIVVDDGSRDRTAEVAAAVSDRVRVIRQPNAGIAAARNTALSHARAPLIAFCDHDDLWHPGKLPAQLARLAQEPEVGMVYGEFIGWNPDHAPRFPDAALDPQRIDARLSGWIYPELLLTNWVLFSTAVFRREVFDRIGLFDPALPPADDWDVAVRASRHFRFTKLAQPVALYRQHAGQTSRKPAPNDLQSDVRDRFISLYGISGPDGRSADLAALRQRRFSNHFSHGHMAYGAGMFDAAARSFHQAWALQRLDLRAAAYWAASTMRARWQP